MKHKTVSPFEKRLASSWAEEFDRKMGVNSASYAVSRAHRVLREPPFNFTLKASRFGWPCDLPVISDRMDDEYSSWCLGDFAINTSDLDLSGRIWFVRRTLLFSLSGTPPFDFELDESNIQWNVYEATEPEALRKDVPSSYFEGLSNKVFDGRPSWNKFNDDQIYDVNLPSGNFVALAEFSDIGMLCSRCFVESSKFWFCDYEGGELELTHDLEESLRMVESQKW